MVAGQVLGGGWQRMKSGIADLEDLRVGRSHTSSEGVSVGLISVGHGRLSVPVGTRSASIVVKYLCQMAGKLRSEREREGEEGEGSGQKELKVPQLEAVASLTEMK